MIKRYTITFEYLFDEDFVEDSSGEWVKYEEIKDMVEENNKLREQLVNTRLKVLRIKEII